MPTRNSILRRTKVMHESNTLSGPTQPADLADGRSRRWQLRSLAVILGLMPLIVIEVGVRLFAPLGDTNSNLDRALDYSQLRPLFVLDHSAGIWQIPDQRMNFFRPASFPDDKGPATRRIFVLGGSTTQGRPYETETAFSSWLQIRLQTADPDHDYEVINCGGVSYASYRVARVLDEVLGHSPDAIVLYTGHNEFLESRTYQSIQQAGLIGRTVDALGSHLRSVRWLRKKFTSNEPADAKNKSAQDRDSQTKQATELHAEVDTILDHERGLASYQRDDEWKQNVQHHFAETFQGMVDAAADAGVPMIVCTPASDCVLTPPFKSQSVVGWLAAQQAQFEANLKRCANLEMELPDRLAAVSECLRLDPDHPAANYLAGRLASEHQTSAATLSGSLDDVYSSRTSPADFLIRARDNDVCPLRATSAIVESVRQTASRAGLAGAGERPFLAVVDIEAELDRFGVGFEGVNRSVGPDGIADPEWFVDHVHPSIAGHQRIAQALARQLEALGWVRFSSESEARYKAAVTERMSGLDEAYFHRGKQRLAGLTRWTQGRAAELGTE